MKEEIKTAERELNKRERNNLPDTEFKTLVVRMPEELSEDLSSIKKIQSEMKDSLIETKSDLQGNNSRVDGGKNQSAMLEHEEAENNQLEQEEEKGIQKMRTA